MIKIKPQSIILFAACLVVCLGLFASSNTAKGSSGDLFKGKKVLVVGDSIQIRSIGAYVKRAALILQAGEVGNKAISGATLANINKKSVYRQIKGTKDLGKFNYYFIAAGYNDYGFSVRTGSARSANKNLKTTCGALRKMILKIRRARAEYTATKKNPDGKKPQIIVVSPLYSFFHSNASQDYGKRISEIF